MTEIEFTDQADRIIFSSMFRAECHVAGGRHFGNVHIGLGATAGALAAGASASAFTSMEILAGSLGIAAAGVTALLTALRPDERSQLHWNAANSFALLANKTYMLFKFGSVPPNSAGEDQSLAIDDAAETSSRRRLIPDPNRQPPVSLRSEETTSAEAISPQGALVADGSPLDVLVALQSDYYNLDAAGPPLPGRLSKKATKALAEDRAWHPPQYEAFRAWRDRIVKRD